ncbi:hypothetical protein [Sphingopyxis sp. BE249]|nr:hypothetical protein [Sphingopyxis sp. BE249]
MKRVNDRMASEATLFRAAAVSVVSPKEGGGIFRKMVSALLGK